MWGEGGGGERGVTGEGEKTRDRDERILAFFLECRTDNSRGGYIYALFPTQTNIARKKPPFSRVSPSRPSPTHLVIDMPLSREEELLHAMEQKPGPSAPNSTCEYPLLVSPGGCWIGTCEMGRVYWEPSCTSRWGHHPCLRTSCVPGSGCEHLNMLAHPRELIRPCEVAPRCITLMCYERDEAEEGWCRRSSCVRTVPKGKKKNEMADWACEFGPAPPGTPCARGGGVCANGTCVATATDRPIVDVVISISSSYVSSHRVRDYVSCSLLLMAILTGSWLLKKQRPFDSWCVRWGWVVLSYATVVTVYASFVTGG